MRRFRAAQNVGVAVPRRRADHALSAQQRLQHRAGPRPPAEVRHEVADVRLSGRVPVRDNELRHRPRVLSHTVGGLAGRGELSETVRPMSGGRLSKIRRDGDDGDIDENDNFTDERTFFDFINIYY